MCIESLFVGIVQIGVVGYVAYLASFTGDHPIVNSG